MTDRIYIQFAENGNIRKWQREPFDGGTAYLSASLPADVAEMVDRLSEAVCHNYEKDGDGYYDTPLTHLLREAASLIQSQAAERAADKARVAELEAGLESAVKTMRNSRGAIESNQVEDKDVWRQLARGIEAARALLNRRAEG